MPAAAPLLVGMLVGTGFTGATAAITGTIAGAIAGAVVGGIIAAGEGGNIFQGALMGAVSGAGGGAMGSSLVAADTAAVPTTTSGADSYVTGGATATPAEAQGFTPNTELAQTTPVDITTSTTSPGVLNSEPIGMTPATTTPTTAGVSQTMNTSGVISNPSASAAPAGTVASPASQNMQLMKPSTWSTDSILDKLGLKAQTATDSIRQGGMNTADAYVKGAQLQADAMKQGMYWQMAGQAMQGYSASETAKDQLAFQQQLLDSSKIKNPNSYYSSTHYAPKVGVLSPVAIQNPNTVSRNTPTAPVPYNLSRG